ncbi:MAG: hypothetical protein C4324_06950 [Blastocatellia bacterium]
MPKRVAISARDNSKLKLARRVRDGREAKNLIFIEGIRLSEEIIEAGGQIHLAFLDPKAAETGRLRHLADRLDSLHIPIVEISDSLISSISDTANPQGIVVIAERPHHPIGTLTEAAFGNASAPAIYFSAVNNPLNLGAAIRSVAAAGSPAIFTSPSSADAFSAKANRAAMGSNFRVRVIENVALSVALESVRGCGLLAAAAVVGGENNYAEIDWASVGLVVFGSEAHGLSAEELKNISLKFTIPMENGVESLNLAVSAGIVAFEARRQRVVQ